MWRCFNTTAGHKPFVALPISVDLNDKNTAVNKWSMLSEKLDFSKEDRAPDGPFNEIIWKAVKGLDSPCPAPVHAAFFAAGVEEDD